MMRAVQVKKFGDSKVLKVITDAARPVISNDEILIKVKCSGVNPVDTYIREGQFSVLPELPYIPGKDGSGIVEAIGSSVSKFKVGDRVFFTNNGRFGSLAEFTSVKQENVFPLHQNLSFAEGAALPVPYFTAYRALFIKGGMKTGFRVLVHGASGAVGQATVQLAAFNGAVVVGTVGTADGEEIVLQCGAESVYNHRKKGYLNKLAKEQTEKFDIIVEMLANVNLDHDICLLRPRGCVVVVGCRGDVKISPRGLMGPETSIVGCALFSSSPEEWATTGEAVVKAVETGVAKPRVSKHYSLEQVSQAHDDIMSGDPTLGKLVVDVSL